MTPTQRKALAEQIADPLKPSPALLCKLGSLVVHADELSSADGHDFDRIAMIQLLNDPEVMMWMDRMRRLAMIPEKRR